MKILITSDTYFPVINGISVSIYNLYTQLTKLGNEVKILTLSQEKNSKKEGDVYYIKSFPCKVYPNTRITISYFDKFLQEIIDWKPDIIHTQTEFSAFLFAEKISKALNIPIVHTYHTLYSQYTDYFIKNKTIGNRIVSLLSKKIMNKTDIVIAPTDKVKNELLSYKVKTFIQVLPTGIDFSSFQEQISLNKKSKLKEIYGISEKEKILITVGRLGKEKNISELLVNFKELLTLNDNIRFLIVGDGPNRDNLIKESVNLNINNKVIFTGMISRNEIADYYKISDIFMSASTSETQGLTYIEALASGLPEICRYDKCLEGVLKDGYNGFSYTNKEEFLNCINKLLNDKDLYNKFSQNAKHSVQKYSAENYALKAEEIYDETLKRYIFNNIMKKSKQLKFENIGG